MLFINTNPGQSYLLFLGRTNSNFLIQNFNQQETEDISKKSE